MLDGPRAEARSPRHGGCFFVLGSMRRWLLTGLALACIHAATTQAEVAQFFDEPDTVFASNTVIDIIEHNGGIWFATGEGVNFSLDTGRTWLLYNAGNGLVSDNVSAIFSLGRRLWVGTNTGFGNQASSDGVSYSDDMGRTWVQINFGPDGLDIPFVWGGGGFRTIYDITGHHQVGFFDHRSIDQDPDWVFFTAFAGGLLASQDNGAGWRRIFPTLPDSLNFANTYSDPRRDTLWERNRYFSCVADTSHHDSLYLWAGSADGLFQFVYASPRTKPYSNYIMSIAFCHWCVDSSFVFIGGSGGLTRATTTGQPYTSRFEVDGLPGPSVTAVKDFGGRLFAGTADLINVLTTGLAVSDDNGNSFTPVGSFPALGPNSRILDFAVIDGRLYVAAEEAGLFVSPDTGRTWDHIYVDSAAMVPENRRNVVHALDGLTGILWAGTDSGLVTLYLDAGGNIDSTRFEVFPENQFSSTMVIQLRPQIFYDSTGSTIDSLALWTVNRSVTGEGTPVVFRLPGDRDTLYIPVPLLRNRLGNDVNFVGDSIVVVVGVDVAQSTRDQGLNWHVYQINTENDNLNKNNITLMQVRGDTLWFGSNDGFAFSTDGGETFDIVRVNKDTLRADFVIDYDDTSTFAVDSTGQIIPGLSGPWIPVLGAQHLPNEHARIWASTRPTKAGVGYDGISVGVNVPIVEELDTTRWVRFWYPVYRDGFAWNFAFNGDSVFAATNSGLLFNHQDTGLTWDTLDFVDSLGNPMVLPSTPVYGVEVIGEHLWVGTGDRVLRYHLGNLDHVDLALFVVDSLTPADQVYAFPVPFSHSQDQAVDFHFRVERDADVTLEIFDFGMNLVTTVIDNQFFAAGIYPGTGQERKTWNGRNDRGDQVAVGMYYFKVEYSTGEVRWGKLAVVP